MSKKPSCLERLETNMYGIKGEAPYFARFVHNFRMTILCYFVNLYCKGISLKTFLLFC